jgi:hypothetical protein
MFLPAVLFLPVPLTYIASCYSYIFAGDCCPKQRAKSASVAVMLSRSTLTCRFISNQLRNIGKCGKFVARLKWESEHIMRGRLPTLKIASRQMAPRGCDDDLPMIHMFTENYFWLATCVISDEIKSGYGCLSSPRCLHIPFLKPRRQLGNGNMPVSTVFDKLLRVRLLIAIDSTNHSPGTSPGSQASCASPSTTPVIKARSASPGAFPELPRGRSVNLNRKFYG